MDWVKPKSERNGKGLEKSPQPIGSKLRRKIAAAPKPISAVSEWIESLRTENIERLQKTLPVDTAKKSRKRRDEDSRLAESLQWGIGTLDGELDEGYDVLQRLVQIYSRQLILPGRVLDAGDSESDSATQLQFRSCENIAAWLSRSLPVHASDPYVAISGAAWIHGLGKLARELPQERFFETLQSILTQTERAAIQKSESLLPWLIWSCETPIALATQLSYYGGQDRLVVESQARLRDLLLASLKDHSRWLARGGRDLRALLASVIRTRWTENRLGAKPWTAKVEKAFSRLVEIALDFTAPDGTALLDCYDRLTDDSELWTAAIKLCSDSKDLAKLVKATHLGSTSKATTKPSGPKTKQKKSKSLRILREPGQYFERAELASLRRSWTQPDSRIAIDFSRDPMWLDLLGAGGRRLISGNWDLELTRDGKTLDLDVAWSEVCWFSDDDVDYLEMEAAVEGQCRVQRQVMLIRDEGWILFSDTLLADTEAEWRLETSWAVGEGLNLVPASKSHEAELRSKQKNGSLEAILLPLALPEWRRQASTGSLTTRDNQILLHQSTSGRRIYNPLLIATRAARCDQPFTWRHLTVAEDLQIQSRNVAQAYRVQIGSQQVVIYRSLANTVRRSTLGLHLNSEFYCGRVDSDEGTYEPIVEISSD